jgi:hypothetical protein
MIKADKNYLKTVALLDECFQKATTKVKPKHQARLSRARWSAFGTVNFLYWVDKYQDPVSKIDETNLELYP